MILILFRFEPYSSYKKNSDVKKCMYSSINIFIASLITFLSDLIALLSSKSLACLILRIASSLTPWTTSSIAPSLNGRWITTLNLCRVKSSAIVEKLQARFRIMNGAQSPAGSSVHYNQWHLPNLLLFTEQFLQNNTAIRLQMLLPH